MEYLANRSKTETRMLRSMHLRVVGGMLFAALLLTAPIAAQNAMRSSVPAAGSGPAFDLSLGASYLAMSAPTGGSANLYGADASGVMDFSRFWGATADAGYVRTSDVLSLGHSSYIMTFMGGPVFYPFEGRNTRVSFRALVGAGLVDSAVPENSNYTLHGWVARPSYAVGVGVQHAVTGPFAVRVDADYLRTSFVDSTDTVTAQNNLRLTLSVVFHVRDRQF